MASLTSSIPLADNICWGRFVRQYHTPCPFLCHTCVGNWLHCEWYIAPNPLFLRLFKRKSLSYHVSKTDPQVVENLIFATKSTILTKVQRMYEMVRFVEFKISRTFCSYSIWISRTFLQARAKDKKCGKIQIP